MKKALYLFAIVFSGFFAHGQSFTFTGTITDAKSQPLPGVTVHLLNTNLFSVSDSLGRFSLPSVAKGNYTLQFTAVGYAVVDKTVGTDDAVSIQLSENFTQLDDVVVTAQKQEENLQNIPVSVTPITERQVQEFRIWNSKDITAIVPNLYSANPGDGRNVTSIRGITSTSYDPSVATYIDGVNQFGLDTYIAQLFDVERIEVLRGPQGTLYGRNAMGGVVNIITKQPTNKTSGFLEATGGSADQQRYAGAFRTPIINDRLFLGVSAVYDHNGGFYTNQFNNSKFDNKHSFTGNYYLKYLPNLRWALTLNAKHNQNRNSGAFPLAYPDDAKATPFQLNQNAVAKMVDDVLNTSFSAVHSGTKLNFSSQTSYQSNYRYYRTPIDADFSPIDGVSIINNYGRKFNNTKVVTQEFKFSSPAATVVPIQWTAGSYLFYQYSPVKQSLRYGADAPFVGANPDSTATSTTKAHSAGAAVYGQMSYTIARTLTLTAGLRYDYERKSQSIHEQYQRDFDPVATETRPTTSASVSFGAASPKLIISWRPAEANTLYASWSRGYRTGGLTAYSSDPSQPPLSSYKPEYSSNLEAGVKNTFLDNHLRANLSVFYINVTDAQYPKFVIPGNIISNAGSLTSKGAELELSANPFAGLQLNYNLGINDSKFKNVASNESFAGKHQIFSPPITSMLAIQYGMNFSDNRIRSFIRGEWMYLGNTYFNYIDEPLKQNGYSILNARAGVAFSGFELSVWERNLGNQRYIDYAYDFGAVHLGNPRNCGVTLRKNF